MADWPRLPLGKAFKVQLGKMLGAGSEHGDQHQYLANRNVQWGRIVIDELGTMHFSAPERERYRLQSGDLLVCEGGEVGRAALWSDELPECYFQNAIHRLRATGIVDPRFMRHYFEFAAVAGSLRAMTGKTSIGHLPRSKLVRWRVPVPQLEEQRRIAEILDTIEETIQATERVIAKQRALQAGLAADLLKAPSATSPSETSKPNETMPPHDSTNIFEISDMPERTETLGQYVRLQTSQIVPAAFPSESFDHYSIPAFDETGGAIPTTGATIESGKFLLSEPAVLVSKLNPRKMRVQLFSGRSANRAVASTEFMVYEPRENADISIQFLAHLLNGNDFAQRLQSTATGTTNSHVRARPKETLRWPVSIPLSEEQRRIAEILDTADGATQQNEAELTKLRELRAGLAADLLSGRVRTVAL